MIVTTLMPCGRKHCSGRSARDFGGYARAWAMGREWPGQDFSLTDRQAFAAIERSGRHRAWSYDDDFAVIRIGPSRTEALELMR